MVKKELQLLKTETKCWGKRHSSNIVLLSCPVRVAHPDVSVCCHELSFYLVVKLTQPPDRGVFPAHVTMMMMMMLLSHCCLY